MRPTHHASQGFSILEVMIAIAILATVLSVLAGNIFTLSTARTAAKESAIVNEVMRGLVERIQAADFTTLGQLNSNRGNLGAWSWHRRRFTRPPAVAAANPPMTEEIPSAAVPLLADAANVLPFANCLLPIYDGSKTLISPGILQEPSGVRDLRIYIEYYREEVIRTELTASLTPGRTFREICSSTGAYAGQNALIFPDDNTMNTGEIPGKSVLIRLLVTWTSQAGGTREREISVARRL